MKKLLSVILLAVVGASLFSCAPISNGDIEATTVFISYDYGMVNKGKITTLYNGCFIDFEYKKPDKVLIPGDSITFKHTGYMLSTMSYPGHTQLSSGKIKDVIYTYATVREIPTEAIIRNENGVITSVDSIEGIKYVIINGNYDFVRLTEYSGEQLFASYLKTNNSEDAMALFAFNPRE
jgi:hypothetical protein